MGIYRSFEVLPVNFGRRGMAQSDLKFTCSSSNDDLKFKEVVELILDQITLCEGEPLAITRRGDDSRKQSLSVLRRSKVHF